MWPLESLTWAEDFDTLPELELELEAPSETPPLPDEAASAGVAATKLSAIVAALA